MRKSLLLLSVLAGGLSVYGQQTSRQLTPATNLSIQAKSTVSPNMGEKTLLCVDTIRYAQAKEQAFGTSAFYNFEVWNADVESVSQTYTLSSGSSLSVSGVEVYGAVSANSTPTSIVVRARLYSVDAAFTPTTLLATASATITGATNAQRFINFASPVTVSANYAIVIDVTTTNGVLQFLVNDIVPGQVYDELNMRYKSNYYPGSAGAYVSVPTLTTGDAVNFAAGPYNFEALIAPIISYTVATTGAASPTTACLGTPVTFTNSTTPLGILNNKMYNYQVLNSTYGGAISDSTYVWNYGNTSPLAWTGNNTYTYPAAGTFNATLFTLAGFWNSCLDNMVVPITINPIPATPTITAGGPTTFCAGGNVVLTSSAANGNTWSNTNTTQGITVTTSGSYTVTASALGCTSPSSAPTVVTVNSLDDASFAFPTTTICDASPNQTPTTALAGTFSSTPAGLNFVSTTTGEINVAGSTPGTYSVSYNTSGSCPNQTTQSITITSAPDATFSYAQPSYCTGGTNPNPVFGSGTSTGIFSSTTGLSLNASNGIITLASSTPGTYVVTNSIAANGACPADAQTFTVSVEETPTLNQLANTTVCSDAAVSLGVITSSPATATIGWSNSQTSVGLGASGIGNVPAFTATNTTTAPVVATVTYSAVNGACASSPLTYTITVNPNPVVAISAVSALCDNASPVTITATPAGGTLTGTGLNGNSFDPTIGAGSYPITYDFTDANGCMGSDMISIVVNASPTVTQTQLGPICLQSGAITLTGGSPANGTYSGTGVTSGMFNPATTGAGSQDFTYTFQGANGCSNFVISSITVNDCLSIDENELGSITLYPNPVTDVLVISYNENGVTAVQVSIYAEDGKLVTAPFELNGNTQKTISTTSFAAGIYFVNITSENGLTTKRFIVK